MFKKNIYKKIFVIFVLLMLHSTFVFAHNMIIEPVSEGVVRVIFEGGSLARYAEVIVYDKDGQELTSGKVDENAEFSYPQDNAAYLVAADSFGHRVEWEVGILEKKLPKIPMVAGILILFGSVAYYFNKKSGKD
jgi:hypothetical protein